MTAAQAFQYPLADRRACGTNVILALVLKDCFSILLRIVELAAVVGRIESNVHLFQYPLADRRACGQVTAVAATGAQGFSILLRIVELAV